MVKEGSLPGWLGGLVEAAFFVGCHAHESKKKNEKNIFCLECCRSICPHCAPSHTSHPLLQVRRYVYNDVVRLDDLEKLIDCSHLQPYTINSAKVVFLKPRPQSRPFKSSGNICLMCHRILQEPFRFCSLSCKVDHIVLQGEDLSSILHRLDESDFAFSTFDSLRVDADMFVDVAPCSIFDDSHAPPHHHRDGFAESDGAQVEPVKRKKAATAGGGGGDGRVFFPKILISLNNRRKGAPHRSPLS